MVENQRSLSSERIFLGRPNINRTWPRIAFALFFVFMFLLNNRYNCFKPGILIFILIMETINKITSRRFIKTALFLAGYGISYLISLSNLNLAYLVLTIWVLTWGYLDYRFPKDEVMRITDETVIIHSPMGRIERVRISTIKEVNFPSNKKKIVTLKLPHRLVKIPLSWFRDEDLEELRMKLSSFNPPVKNPYITIIG